MKVGAQSACIASRSAPDTQVYVSQMLCRAQNSRAEMRITYQIDQLHQERRSTDEKSKLVKHSDPVPRHLVVLGESSTMLALEFTLKLCCGLIEVHRARDHQPD